MLCIIDPNSEEETKKLINSGSKKNKTKKKKKEKNRDRSPSKDPVPLVDMKILTEANDNKSTRPFDDI